jgi:DNA-binding response OmpR family regulator
MMPYYSGLEVVSHTRVTLGKSTPILMLSSMGLEKIVLDAFELGADDFITKPFSPQELSVRVKKALIRR